MADQQPSPQDSLSPNRRHKLSLNTQARFSLPRDTSYDEPPSPTEGYGSRSQSATDSPLVREANSAVASPFSSSSDLPLRQKQRQRGTSISFKPQVKLEDGQECDLEAPLPKPPAALAHGNTVGGQSHDRSSYLAPRDLSGRPRRNSETGTEQYDPMTGEPLSHRERESISYHSGEMRHPFLQSTVDELAQERRQRNRAEAGPPRALSLAHHLPSSPLAIDGSNSRRRPQLLASPEDLSFGQRPLELGPELNRSRRSASTRSFGSGGSVGRRHRSTANSSGPSPAHSFLNSWMRSDVDRAPDPDEEGQQIGGDADIPTYIIGRKIGFGGFSVVREATTIEADRKIVRAVKIVRKKVAKKTEEENEELQAQFESEVNVWRYLRHRCILPLIAVYETEFATFCITELHTAGTLFDMVRRHRKDVGVADNRGLEPRLVKRYLWQLASAIRYLHEDVRVVHRDIKPENCLVDLTDPLTKTDGGKVLLCDFGMADFISDERKQPAESSVSLYMSTFSPDSKRQRPEHQRHDQSEESINSRFHGSNAHLPNVGPAPSSTNVMGSIEYCAPELLNASYGLYSPAADMWAYGCVAHMLVTCERAFHHEFQPRLVMMIEKGDLDEERLKRSLSASECGGDGTLDFLTRCLCLNPEERMTVGEALGHVWLKDAAEEEE
jgi:serine/threonine protein kinase